VAIQGATAALGEGRRPPNRRRTRPRARERPGSQLQAHRVAGVGRAKSARPSQHAPTPRAGATILGLRHRPGPAAHSPRVSSPSGEKDRREDAVPQAAGRERTDSI
jgi:hypothetical protein